MTREERQEATAQLERLSRNLASIGENVDYTEFAIKALEQEPILDKIRSAIETEPYISKTEVLNILDKYRAESEV